MQDLDERRGPEIRRASTPKRTKGHVSDSPALIRTNRDDLAAIRNAVARLKTDTKLAENHGPQR